MYAVYEPVRPFRTRSIRSGAALRHLHSQSSYSRSWVSHDATVKFVPVMKFVFSRPVTKRLSERAARESSTSQSGGSAAA